MPMLKNRQVMFKDKEAFTNLVFVHMCTLYFELWPTNSVKLDSNGKAIGDINNNAMNKEEILLVPDTNQYQHQNQPDAFSSLPMLQNSGIWKDFLCIELWHQIN